MIATELIFIISVTAFALCSRGLLAALTESRAVTTVGYSRAAMRIGRRYKIFAWGLMCAILFISTLSSFLETFLSL